MSVCEEIANTDEIEYRPPGTFSDRQEAVACISIIAFALSVWPLVIAFLLHRSLTKVILFWISGGIVVVSVLTFVIMLVVLELEQKRYPFVYQIPAKRKDRKRLGY